LGAKSAFLHHFYTKNDPFIKTGSGQTQGNAEKREARFSAPQGPYSNTYQNEDHTFSFGIWKNVYLLPVAAESAVCIRYENRLFMLHSEMIILPRQARDKHRNI